MVIPVRRRNRALILVIAALGLTVLVSGVAYAFYTSTGSAGAFVTVGTLNPPTNVTVPASSAGSVDVSWTAPTGPLAATGYDISRTNTETSATAGVCGTPATHVITTSCTDSAVPLGTYTYQVTAVYRSWTAVSSSSTSSSVTTPRLVFTAQPSNAIAGAGITPAVRVTVQDGAGSAVATAGVTISLAIGANPGSGSLSGTTTATTNASGTATFSGLSINTVGVGYTLSASSASIPSVNSSLFNISAAVPSKLVFTTTVSGSQSASATATIGPFAVQAQDAFGNPSGVGSSAVTVVLSSTSSGTKFFTPTINGGSSGPVTISAGATTSAAFYYADTKAATPSLTAAATVNSVALSSATTSLTIVAGAASRLVVNPSTLSGLASSSATLGPVSVTQEDSLGNQSIAASTVVVSLASNTTGTATFASTSGGTATASVTIPIGSAGTTFFYGDTKAGTSVITATHAPYTAASVSVTVLAASPSRLIMSPATLSGAASTASSLGPVTVTEQDAFGNPVAAGAGGTTVNLSSNTLGVAKFSVSSGGASITSVSIPAGSSSATFYYGDTKAGTSIVTSSATINLLTLTSGTTTATISAAPASKLVFTSVPTTNPVASSSAGTQPFVVQAQDIFGNSVKATVSATLTLSSNSTGTKFFTTASGGSSASPITIASGASSSSGFYYADTRAGTWTLTASGTVNSVTLTAATANLTVLAGAPAAMAFVNCSIGGVTCTGQPISVGNNSSLTLNIELRDAFGNPALALGNVSIGLSNDNPADWTPGTSSVSVNAGASTSAQYTVSHNNQKAPDLLTATGVGTPISLQLSK
jgi:hypothetical protein